MGAWHRLVVTCPLYCEELLAGELEAQGLSGIKIHHGAVGAKGTLEQAYRVCFWSRIANKVLWPLLEFKTSDRETLTAAIIDFPFPEHFSVTDTFSVDSQVSHTFFPNPNIANLVVKDAVADSFRRSTGRRPDVDTESPDVRLHLHLEGEEAALSLELSPQPLFRRALRKWGVEAPLKENVAAVILLRAGWDRIAREGGAFIDLMCGSGTFPIEALLIGLDIAPGAFREPVVPEKWRGHDPAVWQRLAAEVREGKKRALAGKRPTIIGYDHDPKAVAAARENIRSAGLANCIRVEQSDFRKVKPPGGDITTGLVVANPPYGKRLGGSDDLRRLYSDLGRTLAAHFDGFRAAILAGDKDLARAVGLRAEKIHTVYNGPIRCALAHFALNPGNKFRPPA